MSAEAPRVNPSAALRTHTVTAYRGSSISLISIAVCGKPQSRTSHLSEGRARSQDYDLRDDETLPGLQTAINQATANRYGALHLRPPCLARLGLAGIAPGAGPPRY